MNTLMYDYLKSLTRQIPVALKIGRGVTLPASYRSISSVLFCGMGGSAIGGDILRALCSERSKIPMASYRSGNVFPKWAGPGTLVILSSYSGNTREVLDAFQAARRQKTKILILTSGGKLKKTALRLRLPFITIPGGLAPRCALGYLTFSLLPVLQQLKMLRISTAEMKETVAAVKAVSLKRAGQLARQLKDRHVFLYATDGLMATAALRWRTQLEENAKALAAHQAIPEMLHNEIQGWQFPRTLNKTTAVFLTDKEDSRQQSAKIRFAMKHIEKQGAHAIEIRSSGKSRLARLFSLISLGDWVSVELARLYGVDPLPIPVLEAIKKISA